MAGDFYFKIVILYELGKLVEFGVGSGVNCVVVGFEKEVFEWQGQFGFLGFGNVGYGDIFFFFQCVCSFLQINMVVDRVEFFVGNGVVVMFFYWQCDKVLFGLWVRVYFGDFFFGFEVIDDE